MSQDKFIFQHLEEIERPRDNKVFKIGDLVYWSDPDWMFEDQEYQKTNESSIFSGNIDEIYLIHYSWDKPDIFHIEISLTNESPHCLGRLPLNDIEFDSEDIEDVSFYDEDYWNMINNKEIDA